MGNMREQFDVFFRRSIKEEKKLQGRKMLP